MTPPGCRPASPPPSIRRRETASTSFSLPASLLRPVRRCGFDNPHRPIAGHKGLRSHPPNVGLGYLLNPVHSAEELAPIVITRLIGCQLRCQPRIVVQSA